jgi:hypothetical protein
MRHLVNFRLLFLIRLRRRGVQVSSNSSPAPDGEPLLTAAEVKINAGITICGSL